ncbi:MAG: hypothetical protein PHP69_04585 [Candidatus Omnitrophica bacterium]|nr:hypothetical protein [Candidatus Omnitrophota bacterium]MDD5081635.1 hypothetical protein [Candidatus Omnitrophota bacterium]MDD5441324.1 hypothetical protein [Candidatus Omnitrophota bacterium]
MNKKAQSILDYATLIAVISVSLAIMSGYVLRSINAKVYHIKSDLSSPVNGIR